MNTDELRDRPCPFYFEDRGHRFRADDGLIYCERCGEVRHLDITAAPSRLSTTVNGPKVDNVTYTT